MLIASITKLLRVNQWVKNLFIFLPLFFSGQIFDQNLFVQSILVFLSFCFIASSIYCFNDIRDVEADRAHPKKCNRPIASNQISIRSGYFIMAVCFVISLSIVALSFSGIKLYSLFALLMCYYFMNMIYSLKLKKFPIIDVIIISIGFVLRVWVGGVATDIWLSEWIIIMTFLLALFIAFAKRRDDVIIYEKTGVLMRNNTNRYNLDFMNQIITSISTITIIAYIMFTISPDVTHRFQSRHLYLTSIFVIMGIIRYLQLTIVDHKSGSPTDVLFKDKFIQACVTAWIITFLILIYL